MAGFGRQVDGALSTMFPHSFPPRTAKEATSVEEKGGEENGTVISGNSQDQNQNPGVSSDETGLLKSLPDEEEEDRKKSFLRNRRNA